MKICKLPTASVRFDKTSLPFFRGKLGPLTFSFRGPAQNLGALGYWAPVSLFPCLPSPGPIMTISLTHTNVFPQLSIMSELAESFQSAPELNTSIKYNHQELMEELDRMNRELKEMKESVLKTSGKFRFLHIQLRRHLLSPPPPPPHGWKLLSFVAQKMSSSCYVVYQRYCAP